MSLVIWNLYLGLTGITALLILIKEKDIKWLLYAILGSIYAGLIFDLASVQLGYYTFHIPNQFFGVPYTVFIAEGFSIIIFLFLFEKIWKQIN